MSESTEAGVHSPSSQQTPPETSTKRSPGLELRTCWRVHPARVPASRCQSPESEAPDVRHQTTVRVSRQCKVLVHQRHVQALPPSIHTVDDNQCLCQEGRLRQAGAAPVRIDVKAKESRLPQGTEKAPGDPSLRPSREADHVRLRKSDLGSPKRSVPECETARMCFPLDASPMEKGEIKLHDVLIIMIIYCTWASISMQEK